MNAATMIVLMILAAVVAGAVGIMIKDKKNGKSSCGGNCSACGICSSCRAGNRTGSAASMKVRN